MIVQGSIHIHLVTGEQLILHEDEITTRDASDPRELATSIWNETQQPNTALLVAGSPHPKVMCFTPSAVVAVSISIPADELAVSRP